MPLLKSVTRNGCYRCNKPFGMNPRKRVYEWRWAFLFLRVRQFCSDHCRTHYRDVKAVQEVAKRYDAQHPPKDELTKLLQYPP